MEILLVFDLKYSWGVLFSITLVSWLWQECSPGTFYLNLYDGAHSCSTWNLTQSAILQKELPQVRFSTYFENN